MDEGSRVEEGVSVCISSRQTSTGTSHSSSPALEVPSETRDWSPPKGTPPSGCIGCHPPVNPNKVLLDGGYY